VTNQTGLPRVSVVIPAYRRAEGVGKALDSIRESRLDPADIEVIVVDNASGDGIEEVLESRRGEFPRLIFRAWPENVGPLENWRRGIDLATAPWLKIIWSDDLLEPEAIGNLLQAAERNNAVVVTCRAAVDYPDGRSVARYLDTPTTLTPDIVISELLHFPAGLPSSPGAALIRTTDARAALASDLPEVCWNKAIGPDLLMTYWGVFNGGIGVHLPDVLARFSAGDDSITVRTPRAVLSSCYCAAMSSLLGLTNSRISITTERRLRSRAALDERLGGELSALITPRRLSLRATAYDSYQIGRHWFESCILRRHTI
jgi:glycosyltransferase involved in cell wall biosynthesis